MKHTYPATRKSLHGAEQGKINYHRDQRGMFALTTTLSLVVIFAFLVLGIEIGMWYITRAEMSKSVDAAALVGARNISNDALDEAMGGSWGDGTGLAPLVKAVGEANFTTGFFGAEAPQIAMSGAVVDGKVTVEGSTNVFNQVAKILDTSGTGAFDKTKVTSTGAAQKRDSEVILVLDESGSMSGAMTNLKAAATSFVEYFDDTQDEDLFGLVTFASGIEEENDPVEDYEVTVHLQTNFVSSMTSAIDSMTASGGTNTEDALDRADGHGGFTDQTDPDMPEEDKVQQFLVFFSDGQPTAFRGTFTRDGNPYDKVAYVADDDDWNLMEPDEQFQWSSVRQYETGDGLPTGSTACQSSGSGYSTTKWEVLSDPVYGVNSVTHPEYSSIVGTTDPLKCKINKTNMKNYARELVEQMAIDHAQELKDAGVEIYTVGMGSVDPTFLAQIASGPSYEYLSTTSTGSDLTSLFQKIAANIKLRLVQH